jgi:hypothetical protein
MALEFSPLHLSLHQFATQVVKTQIKYLGKNSLQNPALKPSQSENNKIFPDKSEFSPFSPHSGEFEKISMSYLGSTL